jgi:hypothetical protein
MVRWQRDFGRPRLTLVHLLGGLDPNRNRDETISATRPPVTENEAADLAGTNS